MIALTMPSWVFYLIKIPRVEICFEFEKKVCQEKNINLNMMLVKNIKN